MKTAAPGKVVISGAYAVLEGAPALVSAVDRYVVCDDETRAEWTTPEVRAALGQEVAPSFDGTALRRDGQKLGLGSSAAILVASLALRLGPSSLRTEPDRAQLAARAMTAHRKAQGGGSGIDVLASAWGGTLLVRQTSPEPNFERVSLPRGLVVRVWASGVAASTADMLRAVERLRHRDGETYAQNMQALSALAQSAARAVANDDAPQLIAALSRQCRQLDALGKAAEVPIVTPQVKALSLAAESAQACFLPSGAGGGDVALWIGCAPPDADFEARAAAFEHVRVSGELGARGVHFRRDGLSGDALQTSVGGSRT